MKATIDSNGTLTIEPESELEAYALSRWSEDFKPIFALDSKAVICIKSRLEKRDGK